MAYGMPRQEYWEGDPWAVRDYRDAYLLECRKRNEDMWLQGAYFANALAVSLNNAFSKHKIDYMKQPLDIYPKTYAEEQQEIRDERQKLIAQLSMFAKLYNSKQKGNDSNGKS